MRHLSRKRIAACVSVNLAVILAIVSWRSAEPVLAQACGGVERCRESRIGRHSADHQSDEPK